MEKWTYEKSGVSVEAGYDAVRRMKAHAARTKTPGMLEGLGSFGGLFELPEGYKKPILVSGTDSVGSKVMIAFELNKHDTIGIDCVAMCVNDIICMGAKPLYFLDYIGIGGLDPHLAEQLVKGVSEGCVQSGCALIGGETCEMPDIYKPGEYDLVGFAVGVAEKDNLITGQDIKEGDAIIGIASSGLHSNGYTLVRKLREASGTPYDIKMGELCKTLGIEWCSALNYTGRTLGEELLTPTKIYAKLIAELTEKVNIKGIANITGGGWVENIPRMLVADDLKIRMDRGGAPPPNEIFSIVQKWGNIDDYEMYKTFNMGIGMCICVAEEDVGAAHLAIHNYSGHEFETLDTGERSVIWTEETELSYDLGRIEKRKEGEDNIVIV
ncbi:MAG: phosphoribosylformylglycinamidine cyclo-ligase [Oscillospiraceae bacterium]|nr:phosphoribosylformylglycinamidine cyclo-ligase [Oscillospiraceae bacterium]